MILIGFQILHGRRQFVLLNVQFILLTNETPLFRKKNKETASQIEEEGLRQIIMVLIIRAIHVLQCFLQN